MADRLRRCAIYTRKSSDEGFDQAYNSLDAQRDACAAYITSQKHEGWIPLETRYDDGGFSGGSKERPALKALLADIANGAIDIIVVYKIDRLTRSLADFAKLTETLDRHGVSFVAVTQQFNTSTSMGRLTLNVLLSFAQFEREVAGERIRDKIAASKRRGMWMGGRPPIGYNVKDRKLVVNEQEAETVSILRPKDVGRPVAMFVLVSLERERADIVDRFKQSIRQTPEVMNGYYVTGESDFLLIVTARSMEDYEAFTRKFFYENPDIKGFKTMVIMDRVKIGFSVPIDVDDF